MKSSLPILAALLFLTGCVTPRNERTLTPLDADKTVITSVETVLAVELPANHTTGFSWHLLGPPNGCLVSQGQPAYRQDSSPFGLVGVGGTEVWRIKATQAGQTQLRFGYSRSWETNVPPAKVIGFNIAVDN
jgi:inhibitor of cysteine peptidase